MYFFCLGGAGVDEFFCFDLSEKMRVDRGDVKIECGRWGSCF